LHPYSDPLRRLRLHDADQRRTEPRREVLVEDLGAAARVRRAGLALAEADRAVMGEVAEGEDEEASGTRRTRASERRRTKPAICCQRGLGPPRRVAAAVVQKARSPRTESRAGSRVKAQSSITAIPIARIGPSQWVDSSSATSRMSIAAITVPAEQLLAVAVDEQQRVVGAGSEHEHEEEKRPLGVNGDPARLDQQVGNPGRDM
jgi:hypothetical protein